MDRAIDAGIGLEDAACHEELQGLVEKSKVNVPDSLCGAIEMARQTIDSGEVARAFDEDAANRFDAENGTFVTPYGEAVLPGEMQERRDDFLAKPSSRLEVAMYDSARHVVELLENPLG
jgi:hypothetical protein